MQTFLVTYDLMSPGKDYQSLVSELQRLGGQRVLLSVWTIQSSHAATDLRDHLAKFVDRNDRVFVAAMSSWAWTTSVLTQPHRAA